MSIMRKAVVGTAYVFIFSILAAGLGYLVRVVMARSLTTADYGLFYAIFSLFTFFTLFGNLGLTEAIQKLIPEYLVQKDYAKIKGVISITLGIQLLIFGIVSLVIALLARQLAESYFQSMSAVVPIMLLAVTFWLRPIVTIFGAVFVGFQQLRYYAIIDGMKMLLVLVFLGLFFNLFGKGILAPSLAYLAAFALMPFLLFPFVVRMFPAMFSTKANMSKDALGVLFSLGLPMMMGMIGGSILVYTDTLILTYFRSLEEVGLYQAAYPTANLLLYVPGAITAMILPLSSELWESQKKEQLREGIDLLHKYTLIIMVFLAAVTASFAGTILSFLFGSVYAGASVPLIVLSLGAILFAVATINTTILSGIGKPGISAKIVLLAATVNVILNFFIIPRYGMAGASLTTFLGYVIILGLTLLKLQEHVGARINISLWVRHALVGALLFVVLAVAKKTIPLKGILGFIAIVPIGFLVYGLLLAAFHIVNKSDIGILKNLLPGKVIRLTGPPPPQPPS